MDVRCQLEDDSANSNPRRPVVEGALSSAHSTFIALLVDGNIGIDSLVKLIIHSAKPSPDDILAALQLRSRYASVVVSHPQSVVAPHDRRATHTSTGGHPRLALGIFMFPFLPSWYEPILPGLRGSKEALESTRSAKP